MKRPCPGPWRLTPAGRARAAQASNEEVVRRLEVAGSRSPAGADVVTRLLIPRRARQVLHLLNSRLLHALVPRAVPARCASPRGLRLHLASTARA
jgi:hypothetical protein